MSGILQSRILLFYLPQNLTIMKKILILLMLTAVFISSCNQATDKDQEEPAVEEQVDMTVKNKEVATIYHDLKAENVDIILTEDFIGRGEDGHTWDRESHRAFLSNESFKEDSITRQFGEGEFVGTMFIRTMDYQGERTTFPGMQVKRFEDGKIVEIWEYWDYVEEGEQEE